MCTNQKNGNIVYMEIDKKVLEENEKVVAHFGEIKDLLIDYNNKRTEETGEAIQVAKIVREQNAVINGLQKLKREAIFKYNDCIQHNARCETLKNTKLDTQTRLNTSMEATNTLIDEKNMLTNMCDTILETIRSELGNIQDVNTAKMSNRQQRAKVQEQLDKINQRISYWDQKIYEKNVEIDNYAT